MKQNVHGSETDLSCPRPPDLPLIYTKPTPTVVEKISRRGDGRGLTGKYEFDLQNQDGARLALDPADRKALVMGLALHAQGQASLAAAAGAGMRRAGAAGRGAGGRRGGAGGDGASTSTAAEPAEPPLPASAPAAAAASAASAPAAAASTSTALTAPAAVGSSSAPAGAGNALLKQALEELLLAEEAFELVSRVLGQS